MLNGCLIQRLAEERRFADIASLQNAVLAKSTRLFEQNFDRESIQQLLAAAESAAQQTSSQNTFNLGALIENFWHSMEQRFMSDFLGSNLVEIFH